MAESHALEVKDRKPNRDMVAALTGEGGHLASGAMPKMGALSAGGEKNLLESLNSEKVQKVKKPRHPKPPDAPAEEVEPKTPVQQVNDCKADVLKHATEARKYALALEHVNYSGELVTGLMDFSKAMESLFKKITKLASTGSTSDKKHQAILDDITERMTWYKQAEARFQNSNQLSYIHWSPAYVYQKSIIVLMYFNNRLLYLILIGVILLSAGCTTHVNPSHFLLGFCHPSFLSGCCQSTSSGIG